MRPLPQKTKAVKKLTWRIVLDNFEVYLVAFLLILILGLVLADIGRRLITGRSFLWIEEIARILFLWTIFIGSAAAIKHKRLVSIDVIYRFGSLGVRKFCYILLAIVVPIVLVLLIYAGTLLTLRFMGDLTPMARVSRGYLYASVVFGSILMLIRFFQVLRPDMAQLWSEKGGKS